MANIHFDGESESVDDLLSRVRGGDTVLVDAVCCLATRWRNLKKFLDCLGAKHVALRARRTCGDFKLDLRRAAIARAKERGCFENDGRPKAGDPALAKQLFAAGISIPLIAVTLNCSPRTVYRYVERTS